MIPLGLRNRISGFIAIAFGLAMVYIIVFEEGWDPRGTVNRYEAFAGGLMFIGFGVWYFFRGASAEPWRANGDSTDPDVGKNEPDPPDSKARMQEWLESMEKDPAFVRMCRDLEVEYRKKLPDPDARLANLDTEEEIDAACKKMEAEVQEALHQMQKQPRFTTEKKK